MARNAVDIKIGEVLPGDGKEQRHFHRTADEYFKLIDPKGIMLSEGALSNAQRTKVFESLRDASVELKKWTEVSSTDMRDAIAQDLDILKQLFEKDQEVKKEHCSGSLRVSSFFDALSTVHQKQPQMYLSLARRLMLKAILLRDQKKNRPDVARREYALYGHDLKVTDVDFDTYLESYKKSEQLSDDEGEEGKAEESKNASAGSQPSREQIFKAFGACSILHAEILRLKGQKQVVDQAEAQFDQIKRRITANITNFQNRVLTDGDDDDVYKQYFDDILAVQSFDGDNGLAACIQRTVKGKLISELNQKRIDHNNEEELKKHCNLILTMGVALQCYGLYREHMPAIDFKNLYDKNAAGDIYDVLVAYLKSDIQEVFGSEDNNNLTLIKESFLLNSLPELLELIVSTKKLDSNVEKDVADILINFKKLISPPSPPQKTKEADNDDAENVNAAEEQAEYEKYLEEQKFVERCSKLFNDRDAETFKNFVHKENEFWRRDGLEEALKICKNLKEDLEKRSQLMRDDQRELLKLKLDKLRTWVEEQQQISQGKFDEGQGLLKSVASEVLNKNDDENDPEATIEKNMLGRITHYFYSDEHQNDQKPMISVLFGKIKDRSEELDNVLINQLYTDLRTCQDETQAVVDQKTYFYQQIWFHGLSRLSSALQPLLKSVSGEKLFESKTLMQLIWQAPKLPQSEDQKLVIKQEYLELLHDYNGQDASETLNIQLKQFMALIRSIQSNQFYQLEEEQQKRQIDCNLEFLSSVLNDYRKKKDRSRIMAETIASSGSNKPSQTQISQLIFLFLLHYFRWEQTVKKQTDPDGKKVPYLKQTQNLMKDSELYTQMIFDVYKQEDSSSDTKSIRLKNFIEEAFSFYHRMEDVCAFVFMHVLSYYNLRNMKDELIIRRKSLKVMLDSLLQKLMQIQDKKSEDKRKQEEEKAGSKSKNKTKKIDKNRVLQSLDFAQHFEVNALDSIERCLGKFCNDLSRNLRSLQTEKRLVKEYREFFVLVWLLLLQIYIFKKDRESIDEDTRDYKEIFADEDKSEPTFMILMNFWVKTRNLKTRKDVQGLSIVAERAQDKVAERQVKNREFLIPSDNQVIDLKEKQLVWLKDIIIKEVKMNRYQALKEVICFIILYQFLTAVHELDTQRWTQNRDNVQSFEDKNLNNRKMIELLPWLVDISETMLKECKTYEEYAMKIENYVHCGYKNQDLKTDQQALCSCLLPNILQDDQGIICTAIQYVLKQFNLVTRRDDVTRGQGSRRSFISRDEAKFFPKESHVNSSVHSMSTRARATYTVFDNRRSSIAVGSTSQLGGTVSVSSRSRAGSFSNRSYSSFSSRGSMSNVSTSKFVNNEEAKTEDAELGLYLLRVVEQFRSIEKKIFAKKRNQERVQQLRKKHKSIFTSYENILEEDDFESAELISDQKIYQVYKDEEFEGYDDCDFDSDEEREFKEEDKQKITMKLQPSLNQLNHAYATVMLLKEKIEHNVFMTCKDLLDETKDCMNALRKLRVQLLWQKEPQLFLTEIAHLASETTQAIVRYSQERQSNKVWLRGFRPKEEGFFVEIINQFSLSNQLLMKSGYCLNAVDFVSDQLESFINQNMAVKPLEKDLSSKDEDAEQKAITESIDTLSKLYDQINSHDENDNKVVNMVMDANYCSYYALQYYGKDLPKDLTISQSGFIIRRRYTAGLEDLTIELKAMVCDSIKNNQPALNRQKVSVITVNGPDVPPEGRKETMFHEQDDSLICITFDLEPMDMATYDAYCPRQDQTAQFRQYLTSDSTDKRDNYTIFHKQNYKKIFYKLNRKLNEDLKIGYSRRVIQKLNDLCVEREDDDCQIDERVVKVTQALSLELFDHKEEIQTQKVFRRDNIEPMVELVLEMIKEKENEKVDEFAKKRWTKILQDAGVRNKETTRSIEPYYVFQNLISLIDAQTIYHDSKLNLYVVADAFPTSFHMQEVQEVSELLISGAARAAFDINQAQQKVQESRATFDNLEEKIQRSGGSIKDSVFVNSLDSAFGFRTWLASDVSGGISVYVRKFLEQDCVHCMKQMSHSQNKQFKDLLLLFGALERLYEALERTMQSARLCLSKQMIIDILDREEKVTGGAKEWISKKKDDLDQLEITYDKLKKEFEDVRERNEIETHREYFQEVLETADDGW